MQQQQQHRQQIINVAVGSRNSHGLALIGNSLSLLRSSSSTSSFSSSSTPLSLSAAFLDVCSFRTTFLPSSSPNINNSIHNGGNQKSSPKAWEEAHVLSFSIDSQSPKAAASLSQRTLLSGGTSSTATTTLLLRFTLYLDAESPASFASELDRLEEWKKAYIEIVYSPQGLFFSEDESNSRHAPTTIVLGRSEFTVEGGAKAVILNYEETSGVNRGVGIMTTSPNASNSWDYVFWYLRARAFLSGMSLVSLPQDWKQPEYASQAFRFALFIARGQTDDVDSASHSAQQHSPLVSNTASRDCYFYATNNASNAIIREQLLKEQMERMSATSAIERTNLMTQTTFDNDAFIKHGCSSSYFAAHVPGASDYVKVHRERVKWRRKTSTEPSQSNFTSSSSSSSSSYLSFSDWATNVISSSIVVPPSSSSVGSLLLPTAETNTIAKPRSSSASSLLQPSSSARPPSTPMSAKTPAPPKTIAAISANSITPLSTPAKASVPLAMNNIASTPIAPRSSILSTSSGKAGIVMPFSSSSLTPTLVCGNKDNVSSIISSSSSLHPASNVSLSAPVSMSSSSRRHSTSSAVDMVSSSSSSSAVASTPSRPTTIDPAVNTAVSSSTPSSQKPPLKKDAAKFFKEMLKKS